MDREMVDALENAAACARALLVHLTSDDGGLTPEEQSAHLAAVRSLCSTISIAAEHERGRIGASSDGLLPDELAGWVARADDRIMERASRLYPPGQASRTAFRLLDGLRQIVAGSR